MTQVVVNQGGTCHYAMKYIERIQSEIIKLFPWGAMPLLKFFVETTIRPIIFDLTKEAERIETPERALVLADAVSDAIWGGERGWEGCSDSQFAGLKSRIYKKFRSGEKDEQKNLS